MRRSYDQELSLAKIGEQYGFAASTVKEHFLRDGIPIRGQGDTLRGKPRLGRVRGHDDRAKKLPMVRGFADGNSYKQIGEAVGRNHKTVDKDLRRMGIFGPGGPNSGGNPFYDFGQRVDTRLVRHLIAVIGLPTDILGKYLEIPKATLDCYLYTNQRHVAPRVARKIATLRKQVIHYLISTKNPNPQDRYGASRVLRTFFPDIKNHSSQLVWGLRQCRSFLDEHTDASIEDLGEWLCEQAMRENDGRWRAKPLRASPFIAFLPWAAKEILAALDMAELRSGVRLWKLAHKLIAMQWGTTDTAVRAAFRTQPIPPSEMRHLVEKMILGIASAAQSGDSAASAKDRKTYRGGRPKGMGKNTIIEAERLLEYMGQFEKEHGTKRGALVFACRRVYGPTVESRKAVQRGNKTLNRYRLSHRNVGQKLAS